jgi:predicted acyltransferase
MLFTCGFAWAALALAERVAAHATLARLAGPVRTLGNNALLAYVLCFLIAPLLDGVWQPLPPLRNAGQAWLSAWLEPRLASLIFALGVVSLLYLAVRALQARGWRLRV